jgi:ribosomal protein S18 acetylase RimI-like enzyme
MNQSGVSERFRIEPLGPGHDKVHFSCGVKALDHYLEVQAGQDMRRNYASVFVATERQTAALAGYYSLSMSGVALDLLPEHTVKKMPRYSIVPAIRLGRLAVSLNFRGMGLGRYLLLDAMKRSLENEIAWAVMVVDAKDDQARSFYEQYAFTSLASDPNHLFVFRKMIEDLFVRKTPL